MLNKTAEKVLKCIIKKSKGNLEESVNISHKDFKDKKITNSFINSVCRQLKKEEYIFEDAYLGDTMRTFITQFSPERFLNMLTNIGELLVELLGLEKEKIIFAIDNPNPLPSVVLDTSPLTNRSVKSS